MITRVSWRAEVCWFPTVTATFPAVAAPQSLLFPAGARGVFPSSPAERGHLPKGWSWEPHSSPATLCWRGRAMPRAGAAAAVMVSPLVPRAAPAEAALRLVTFCHRCWERSYCCRWLLHTGSRFVALKVWSLIPSQQISPETLCFFCSR